MNCHYHFIVAQHIVDGLKLAFRSAQQTHDSQLILVASENPGSSLAFGFVTEENYAGLAGLLHYNADDLVVSIEYGEQSLPVVFANSSGRFKRPYAELLDSARFEADEETHVAVVLEYDRLEQDLPPMYSVDTLSCFWEIRDLLRPRHVDTCRYLADRLENESPRFHGLQLYTRHRDNVDNMWLRIEQIRQFSGICTNAPPIQL